MPEKPTGSCGRVGENGGLLGIALLGNVGGEGPPHNIQFRQSMPQTPEALNHGQSASPLGVKITCPTCLQSLEYFVPHFLGVLLSLDVPKELTLLFLGFMISG